MLPEPSMTSQIVGTTRAVTMFCFAHWPAFKPVPAVPSRPPGLVVWMTCESVDAGALGNPGVAAGVAAVPGAGFAPLTREPATPSVEDDEQAASAIAKAHAAYLSLRITIILPP
jgi:hypothetical protein